MLDQVAIDVNRSRAYRAELEEFADSFDLLQRWAILEAERGVFCVGCGPREWDAVTSTLRADNVHWFRWERGGGITVGTHRGPVTFVQKWAQEPEALIPDADGTMIPQGAMALRCCRQQRNANEGRSVY